MEAAALIISRRKSAPLIVCLNSIPPLTYGIYKNIYGADLCAGGVGNHITHLGNNGLGYRGQIYALVNNDVQVDRNAAVLVEFHPDALAHGLLAEQMVQAVGNGTGCHTLYAKAIGCGCTGNIYIDTGADIDRTFFNVGSNQRKSSLG